MSFAHTEFQIATAFKFNLRAKEFPEYLKLIQSVIQGKDKVFKSLEAEKYDQTADAPVLVPKPEVKTIDILTRNILIPKTKENEENHKTQTI